MKISLNWLNRTWRWQKKGVSELDQYKLPDLKKRRKKIKGKLMEYILKDMQEAIKQFKSYVTQIPERVKSEDGTEK